MMFRKSQEPGQQRGRALTLIISLNYTVLGGSFVIAGPIVDALGARWAWGLAAAVIAVASVVALAIGPRRVAAARELAHVAE